MPRASSPSTERNLARVLIVGDGKCGKTDWAARAAEGGFNVLYVNADVAAQTIAGFTRDQKNPVKAEVMERIFIVNCHDTMIDGGLDYRFVKMFKRFATQGVFRWNDSKHREWELMKDGDHTDDEVWEIRPAQMDENCVLVLDSWTALAQSCMNWAADEAGIDLMEVNESERAKMRSVYQLAGEKLTTFLTMIRSMPCHVVVIAHPREFTKVERTPGKSAREAKEIDMKVLWTKMVPASSSNNHAFQMAKFFTDLAWLEVDAMGNYMIDFRASNDKLSGSHINARLNTRVDGRFVDLIRHIGGAIPGDTQPIDHWLTIHSDGFDAPTGKKSSLVLGGAQPQQESPAAPAVPTVKGVGFQLKR